MRWAIMRGKNVMQSLAGAEFAAREAARDLTEKTGTNHVVEVYSKRFSQVKVGEHFRVVIRTGFGKWNLSPVCKRMNEAGVYMVVGVNRQDLFPANPDAYALPPEKEVLPWGEGEGT